MADIASYISYFEKLASEHTGILHSSEQKHFFMMDINELLSAANSVAQYPAIVLLKLSGKIADKADDNPLHQVEGGFLVLDHCKSVDDFASELSIFQNTFQVGMQFIARINHDQESGGELTSLAVTGFNPDLVRWEMIGPVFENHFGVMFRFPVNLIAELGYDSEKWS